MYVRASLVDYLWAGRVGLWALGRKIIQTIQGRQQRKLPDYDRRGAASMEPAAHGDGGTDSSKALPHSQLRGYRNYGVQVRAGDWESYYKEKLRCFVATGIYIKDKP
mgnify:CR=1 FL=1